MRIGQVRDPKGHNLNEFRVGGALSVPGFHEFRVGGACGPPPPFVAPLVPRCALTIGATPRLTRVLSRGLMLYAPR